MIVIWQPEDIKVGQRVGRPDCKEAHLIGYNTSPAPDTGSISVLISLEDGHVWKQGTKEEIAKTLSNGHYLPSEIL